ncbi:MAG: DUF2848 domain-containing protein [Pseudomonadota bacterium]
MQFNTETKTGAGRVDINVRDLTIAGWTGRDAAAVQHHIDELAAIGVAPPSQVPLFYRVSADLLTTAPDIQVLGEASSGEAEPMLIRAGGKMWIGLGSDHTDRALEAVSVASSKQVCAKPCADGLWDFDLVRDHVDQLQVQSWIWEGGDWVLYQDGTLAQVLPVADLANAIDMRDGQAMMCGTFAAIGGVRGATMFKARLHDPVRRAEIAFSYTAQPLPVVS